MPTLGELQTVQLAREQSIVWGVTPCVGTTSGQDWPGYRLELSSTVPWLHLLSGRFKKPPPAFPPSFSLKAALVLEKH